MASSDDLLLDNQLCFALYSTSLLMTKVYKPLLSKLDLTYPQYLAMLSLWETDGLTVSELSSRMLTDPGSVTPLLKRLENEGLISRTRSSRDERVVELRLTDKGRQLKQKADDIPQCILNACDIDRESLARLRQQVVDLRQRLQRSV